MDYPTLLDELIRQESFTFGDPWRLTEKCLAIVVPILRAKGQKPRGYFVIEEVKDKVDFTDTGSIGGVQARSKADKPVFVRSGSQFGVKRGGVGTQPRSVTVGTVLFPEKVEVLETVCIHASKGISPGAGFTYSGVVPALMFGAVAMANQHATWSSVKQYAARSAGRLRATGTSQVFADSVEGSDDLIGVSEKMEQVEEFKQKMEDFLSKIPADLKGQVGMAVLDLKGVVGLELFDHEDSWKAFSKSIARSYSEVLMKEEDMSDVFQVKQDRIVSHIVDFLESLKTAGQKVAWQKEDAATYRIENKDIIGEYTMLATNLIHLIVTRKPSKRERQPLRLPPIRRYRRRLQQQLEGESTPIYGTTAAVPVGGLEHFFRRKGSKKFLNLLSKPQTWKDLENRIGVSTRTLSKLAKNAATLGLVQKSLRQSNGRVTYELTTLGEHAKKKYLS